MNKVAFATAAIAAMALTTTASAQSENWSDKGGGLSLGVDRNFGIGGTGLAVRYFVSDAFGLELLIGGNYTSTSNSEADTSASQTTLDVGLLGEYRILKSQRANLNAFLGFGINNTSYGGDDERDGVMDAAFELGLRGEVWLYQFFSIYTRVGISVDIDGEDIAGDDTSNTSIGIFRGDLLGTAGFSFWFK